MLNSCQPCDGIIPWTSVSCCAVPLLWNQHQGSAVLHNASAAEQAQGRKPTSAQQIIFTQERSGHGVKADGVHFQVMYHILSSVVLFSYQKSHLMISVPFSHIYTTISNGWFRPAVQEASGLRFAPLRLNSQVCEHKSPQKFSVGQLCL